MIIINYLLYYDTKYQILLIKYYHSFLPPVFDRLTFFDDMHPPISYALASFSQLIIVKIVTPKLGGLFYPSLCY